MAVVHEVREPAPVGAGFIAGLTLAQIGAYISFVPLLQVLLPLKAAMIDPAHKAVTLANITLWGAVAAGFANLIAGAISDRTTSRFGRRRPWLLAGVAGTLLSYVMIRLAGSVAGLLIGIVFFQIVFNFLFAALLALVVDRVPNQQRGVVSALLGLGYPLGNVGGVTLIGGLIGSEAARYLALGLIVLAAVAPFALALRDVPITAAQKPRGRLPIFSPDFWVDPRKHPDFGFAWGGRFLVLTGFSLVQSYMLYYLLDVVRYPTLFPGARAEQGLAVLTAIAAVFNVIFALIGGLLSDKVRRRKPFVILGALVLAGATASFALAPSWPALMIAYAFHGVGTGVYFAVDIALVTQVLPSARDAGKDLGIVNLSNTVPQILAPVLAVGLLGAAHADFRTLFLLAAAVCVGGAVMVAPIRSVR
ncbi:MFS transporter [Phenylobacterium montanum]|uniref:MFS transporter n=1 Tax=Phenylobacterium montanum TaxID=2823693 RepID=A0A975G2P1_9CAUL|nr:MFS transporter [Caulobacter sp. S6]QUD88916.1 MFS transporter [Caulobacter sp. S6]